MATRAIVIGTLAAAGLVAAWGSGRAADGDQAAAGPTAGEVLFSPEGNRLNAHAVRPPFTKQAVIRNRAADPDGWDINGQLCFTPDGSRIFVVGEDTGQPDPPPGWGVFQLRGRELGELSAERIGRLVPTYQPTDRNPDNFGCGFLSDGRVVSTVIGSIRSETSDGQLILWFPPFDPTGPTRSCKIDVAIGMAGQIHVDAEDRVYVASGHGAPGIWRYSGDFPTSADAAGGCGRVDAAGSPLVDEGRIRKEHFIDSSRDDANGTMGLAASPGGSFFTSRSVFGIVAEFDREGSFVRRIVEPPSGARLGPGGFPAGTPSGLAVAADGTLYYADLGLVADPEPRPQLGGGKIRRVSFVAGEPQPPQVIGDGLDYPDVVSLSRP